MDLVLILAIIGIIGTVGFGIVTIVLTRKKKEPVWAYKISSVIELGEKAPEELKLTYNGKDVRDVYRTTILLFNRGHDPIMRENVTKNITFSFDGGEILNEPIIKAISNDAIDFSARREKINDTYVIDIKFHYLDHNDGAVMEILHTHDSSIHCEANIIGAKEVSYIGEFEDTFPKLKTLKNLWGFAVFIVAFVYLITQWDKPIAILEPFSETLPAFAILIIIIGITFTWDFLQKYIRGKKFPLWTRNVMQVATPIQVPQSKDLEATGYCAKCRMKKSMQEPKVATTRGGRKALLGTCPDCGTKILRILPGN